MRNLSTFRALIVVLLCGLLSSWGPVTLGLPAMMASASRAADRYDSFFPEITIRDGKLSAQENRVLAGDSFGAPNSVLIIDTGETGLESRLSALNRFLHGAVITRDAAVVKVCDQIRILPLPTLPDMVLNSNFFAGLVNEHAPRLANRLAVLILALHVGLTLLQASFLALIAYLAARTFSMPLNCSQSWRVASIALIPAVALEFLVSIGAAGLPMGLVARLALGAFSLALCLIYWRKRLLSRSAS